MRMVIIFVLILFYFFVKLFKRFELSVDLCDIILRIEDIDCYTLYFLSR